MWPGHPARTLSPARIGHFTRLRKGPVWPLRQPGCSSRAEPLWPRGRVIRGHNSHQEALIDMSENKTGGRLAQVIATRGGLAPPEAPFVIEHREALIYMLCEAAELEHGIMCQYLFAAFSLKQSVDEGLTEAELYVVTRWRTQISHVSSQEMLHLALVHNLMTAIGGAPHLARVNFPAVANHYPAGVQ